MTNQEIKEGRTMAIISYLFWIGLLIAFIMNANKRNPFASFHIRQALGISLIYSISGILMKISALAGQIVFLFSFVLMIIGLLSAIKYETKKIPLLGDQFQAWFKNII